MSRNPPKAYRLSDWDVDTKMTTYGVVRCPEGDEETFRRLALQLARQELDGDDPEAHGWRLRPPAWRWWRMNPDFTGMYSWLLGEAAGPGRGNWQGALAQFGAPEWVYILSATYAEAREIAIRDLGVGGAKWLFLDHPDRLRGLSRPLVWRTNCWSGQLRRGSAELMWDALTVCAAEVKLVRCP